MARSLGILVLVAATFSGCSEQGEVDPVGDAYPSDPQSSDGTPITRAVEEAGTIEVPDVVGMTKARATKEIVLRGLSLEVSVDGGTPGRVVEQDPSGGTEVEPGAVVRVRLG